MSVDELIAGARAALGDQELSCAALDADRDGAIGIDELVSAVRNSLDECRRG